MKKKSIILLIATSLFSLQIQAQIIKRIGENTKQRAGQKTEQKVDEKVDKTMDKILDGSIFKKKKKEESSTTKDNSNTTVNNSSSTNNSAAGNSSSSSIKKDIKTYSKFDFIPGEKVIAIEDFSNTSVGDFPLGWNTNSSAEIVTMDGSTAKWLSMTKDGFFQPEFIKDMPENFTIEFEAFTRYRSNNILNYKIYIYASDNAKRDVAEYYPKNAFQMQWLAGEPETIFKVMSNGEKINENNSLNVKEFARPINDDLAPVKIKFSIWRQKNRLRIYANESKIIDIPQAFDSKLKYNVFKLGSQYMDYSENPNKDEFMVANFRYAVGAADTRSKLITDGKLVTRGILFDTNSDVINGSSYGVLKDIATVLTENPTVKIKIIGHTDSDGENDANLTLSQKRAIAVKNMLSTEFKIDSSRMLTDGKGESEPSDSNNTAVGKANNRRVEFIKL